MGLSPIYRWTHPQRWNISIAESVVGVDLAARDDGVKFIRETRVTYVPLYGVQRRVYQKTPWRRYELPKDCPLVAGRDFKLSKNGRALLPSDKKEKIMADWHRDLTREDDEVVVRLKVRQSLNTDTLVVDIGGRLLTLDELIDAGELVEMAHKLRVGDLVFKKTQRTLRERRTPAEVKALLTVEGLPTADPKEALYAIVKFPEGQPHSIELSELVLAPKQAKAEDPLDGFERFS